MLPPGAGPVGDGNPMPIHAGFNAPVAPGARGARGMGGGMPVPPGGGYGFGSQQPYTQPGYGSQAGCESQMTYNSAPSQGYATQGAYNNPSQPYATQQAGSQADGGYGFSASSQDDSYRYDWSQAGYETQHAYSSQPSQSQGGGYASQQ